MENDKEKKKIIVPTIIAVITLVMLAIGATYSYFLITSTNNFGTPTIEATTPEIGSVSLTTGENLTMSLTASQMMVGSSDISYYASSSGTTTTATTTNIGTATVVGEGRYTCDYTLTIEDNENSLYDAFQSMSTKSEGQIVLSINGSEYDFNTENLFSKTINRTMTGLTKNTPQNITAELKLVNKVNIDQSELAGKTLTLTFTATNFKCTAEEENQGVDYVLKNSLSEDLWNSELEEDGIRFVGTNPSNYVCFGYNDAETDCDFTNATNTDLYAYRIIGIFEDSTGTQHLKLIKKEALNTSYVWHSNNNDITWSVSDLYKGLNGSYFLTNTAYNYMQESNWLNKIAEWDYNSLDSKYYIELTWEGVGVNYETTMAKNLYLYEMNKNTKISTVGNWVSINSKVSLMYVSDYLLSLGSNALNYTSKNNSSMLKTSWMHLSNNDSGAPSGYEWSMIKKGFTPSGTYVYGIAQNGGVFDKAIANSDTLDVFPSSARPVFYLTSNVTISGEGTINNPFIVS